MAVYIVAYDLDKPSRQYDCIKKKLEAHYADWHFQESVWMVSTDSTAEEIRDDLLPCLDSGDKLFVARLEGESAWEGHTTKGDEWLFERLTKEVR